MVYSVKDCNYFKGSKSTTNTVVKQQLPTLDPKMNKSEDNAQPTSKVHSPTIATNTLVSTGIKKLIDTVKAAEDYVGSKFVAPSQSKVLPRIATMNSGAIKGPITVKFVDKATGKVIPGKSVRRLEKSENNSSEMPEKKGKF